jgi:Uncharacterized protein conserved in bacteria (DUF2239)
VTLLPRQWEWLATQPGGASAALRRLVDEAKRNGIPRHRKSFDGGEPALNEFLQRYARQSHEAGGAKTFVAVKEADGKTILAYYSLAPAARRCLRVAPELRGVILIIDAKSERAAAWYASYDAVPLADKPLTLVMALATFETDLKAGSHF